MYIKKFLGMIQHLNAGDNNLKIVKLEDAEFFYPPGHYGVTDKVLICRQFGAKFDLWYGFFAPEAYSDPHSHDFDQVFFILKGKLNIIINGKKNIIGPNTAVYIQPSEVHLLKNEGTDTVELLVISITGK
jgi:quercetin dioxygenase-like cupin family protein